MKVIYKIMELICMIFAVYWFYHIEFTFGISFILLAIYIKLSNLEIK